MNDEISPRSAETTVTSRKQRRLPKGCWFLLVVAGGLIPLLLVEFFNPPHITYNISKKESQIIANTIANAVTQFYADYNRLPLPSGPVTQNGDLDTDTSPLSGFTAILIGRESATSEAQNTRTINYAEGLKPAKRKPSGDRPWSNGLFFVTDNGPYGIVDYQGNPYRIRLDTNNDKELANPKPDEVAEGRGRLPKQVIVWGAGKDGNWETWDDNPTSWD